MSWKKHFQSSATRNRQKIASRFADDPMTAASPNSFSNRFTSWLPEVYSGQPNRIERYAQYDNMDLDTEINMALDTIADSMTEANKETGVPFEFKWNDGVSEEDTMLLENALSQWSQINDWDKRMWRLVRSILKYGDQFFIRDPDTYKLFWVSPDKIDSVIVDESKGKRPEQYIVRDLDANLQTLVASGNQKKPSDQRGYSSGPMASGQQGGALNTAGRQPGARFQQGTGGAQTGAGAGLAYYVDADNVIHMSQSEGLDNIWPFGISILENVFKVYKQMELIEDAVIIYRVQRAPERRVFYVDTGRLPNHRAMAYLERIKNEIQQKRIPSRTGGQQNVLDATYNPMSMLEDYFFAQNCISLKTLIILLDGRKLTLQEIIDEYNNGKENWVYTINQKTFKMEPGKIAWAGVTRKDADVLKITLDNGESLTVTPDHRFIMRDGSEVEASDLNINDSLMPLYLKDSKTSPKQKGKPYLRYIDNATGKTEWVHTTICPKSIKGKDIEIHHINLNQHDNNPINLIEMNTIEHRELHKKLGSYSLKKQWDNKKSREKLISGMRYIYNNRTSEFDKMLTERNSKNGKNVWLLHRDKSLVHLVNAREVMVEQNTVYMNNIMLNRMNKLFHENNMINKNIFEMSFLLESDVVFMKEYIKHNNGRTAVNRIVGFNSSRIKQLCEFGGYNGYDDYKKKYAKKYKIKITHMSKRTVTYNDDIFSRMVKIKSKYKNMTVKKLSDLLENDDEINNLLFKENKNKSIKPEHLIFNYKKTTKLCKYAGYTSVSDFIDTYSNNHKVTTIEILTNKEDTGDLTIENINGNHTFAVSAGVYIHNSDGKGSRVETLPGGDQLGQIDDMKYFHHKIRTGLRVPRSYMPDFDDGGGAIFNDGRVGTAYIEELRFTKYCVRLQNMIATHFDREFKLFCKKRGINVHASLYQLLFNEPQNFSKYRQTEVDGAVLSVYSQVADIPHISKSYGLMKYAGWTLEDVLENEKWWAIENAAKVEAAKAGKSVSMGDEETSFGDAGASSAGLGGAEGDIGGEFDDEGGNDAAGDGSSSVISGDEGGDTGSEELDL